MQFQRHVRCNRGTGHLKACHLVDGRQAPGNALGKFGNAFAWLVATMVFVCVYIVKCDVCWVRVLISAPQPSILRLRGCLPNKST